MVFCHTCGILDHRTTRTLIRRLDEATDDVVNECPDGLEPYEYARVLAARVAYCVPSTCLGAAYSGMPSMRAGGGVRVRP